MLEYTYEKLLQQNMYTVTSQLIIFDLQKSVSNSFVGQKPIINSRMVNLKSGNVAVITVVRNKAFNACVKYNILPTPTHKIIATNNLLIISNSTYVS